MVNTTVSKEALVKAGRCVIQAGTGSPTNNAFISSISWQQTDSLGIGIVWQQPHVHLIHRKISHIQVHEVTACFLKVSNIYLILSHWPINTQQIFDFARLNPQIG